MLTSEDKAAFAQRKAEFKARVEKKQAERAALEKQAEADGQLWTVQIAYYPSHATACIYFGRIGPEELDAFTSQHQGAHMFLDPTVVLGDKLHVRRQACMLANCDELLIRVIGAPKHEPISPGICKL